MNRKFYIIALLLFWAGSLFAQDAKFTAEVSSNPVGAGEQFEISFSLNGNGDRFTPPDFRGFQVLSGPNTSSSMTIINGNSSMSTSYSYILAAPKEGDYIIGPASIVINGSGRKLSSNAVRLKVVKGQPQQQQQSRPQQQVYGDNEPAQPAVSSDLSKEIFIKAVVDKTNVYLGQQITVSYRLYTRVGIDESAVDKIPDLTGFYAQDVKTMQQSTQWHTEVYKGVRYNTADIKQSVLYPEHAGDIMVDPLAMLFIVRQPTAARNPIEEMFGGGYQQVKYKAKSAPVTIHVKALPEAGKPESFTGAVGNFSMETWIDHTELKANESLNYNVKITGSGNMKLFQTPKTSFPADFEKYDPKLTDAITENLNGASGSRTYNYLLIPRHQGDFTIEPLQFSYFNPNSGRYVTLSGKQFKIKVNKGLYEQNVTSVAGADKQDVKTLGKDIRYLKTGNAELTQAGEGFHGSVLYYLLLAAGPVLCVAAFVYRNKNRKLNADVVQVKSRRASKLAAKHLASAQKQLQANNTKAFYEDLFKGLYGYLSDKLNINYADLNKETMVANLQARSVDEQVINRLTDTLDLCEMARFAPVTHISPHEVFEKAKGIINDIENEI